MSIACMYRLWNNFGLLAGRMANGHHESGECYAFGSSQNPINTIDIYNDGDK